jgi:hypothetical protein
MPTMIIRTHYRINCRKIQYNKADFERLITPIFDEVIKDGGTVKIDWEGRSIGAREYHITVLNSAYALVFRKKLTEAYSLLGRGASYGWEYKA